MDRITSRKVLFFCCLCRAVMADKVVRAAQNLCQDIGRISKVKRHL